MSEGNDTIVPMMIECPNHDGAFDCNPFCILCEGDQEYDPNEQLPCELCRVVMLDKDVYATELGMCVDCSNGYYNHEEEN